MNATHADRIACEKARSSIPRLLRLAADHPDGCPVPEDLLPAQRHINECDRCAEALSEAIARLPSGHALRPAEPPRLSIPPEIEGALILGGWLPPELRPRPMPAMRNVTAISPAGFALALRNHGPAVRNLVDRLRTMVSRGLDALAGPQYATAGADLGPADHESPPVTVHFTDPEWNPLPESPTRVPGASITEYPNIRRAAGGCAFKMSLSSEDPRWSGGRAIVVLPLPTNPLTRVYFESAVEQSSHHGATRFLIHIDALLDDPQAAGPPTPQFIDLEKIEIWIEMRSPAKACV